jgi:hypothetical protein
MITEKHYTDKNEHPEDRIYEVKKFINELENVQTFYYNQLLLDLNLKPEADDYLFDYVYNEDHKLGFGEYLNKLGKSYEQFHENNT